MNEAKRPEILLVYEMNGRPLEPQHGFPLRLIVPGWYGMTHVKWLDRIAAITEPFEGYQQAKQYRTKRDEDDPGEPVTRINPRSLLVPPGIPDFPDRRRFLEPGPCKLEGAAPIAQRVSLIVGALVIPGPFAEWCAWTRWLEVSTLIWATGFRTDDSWVDVPDATDEHGRMRQSRGVTPSPGLSTLGRTWQHTRG